MNNTFFHFVALILGLENADLVQKLLIGAYDVSFKMRQPSRNYLGKKSRDLKWNQQYNLKRKCASGTISVVAVINKKTVLELRSQYDKFMPVYFVKADGAYLSSRFDLMCAER